MATPISSHGKDKNSIFTEPKKVKVSDMATEQTKPVNMNIKKGDATKMKTNLLGGMFLGKVQFMMLMMYVSVGYFKAIKEETVFKEC